MTNEELTEIDRIRQRNGLPPMDPTKKVRMMACGHEERVDATLDDHWLAMEGCCNACYDQAMNYDPTRYLREMTNAQLLAYGRQAKEKADAGSGFWNRRLRLAREEWKRRKGRRRPA